MTFVDVEQTERDAAERASRYREAGMDVTVIGPTSRIKVNGRRQAGAWVVIATDDSHSDWDPANYQAVGVG